MQKYQDVVLDSQGRPVAGAVIAVQEYPGGSSATVYETDAVGAAYTPTTDTYGGFFFYAPNGRYSYTVTVANVLRGSVTDILLYDPDEIEGSWTPTDISGGTAILSQAAGEYIKTGSIVYVSGRIRFASNGDATVAAFSGLPYTAKNSSNVYVLVCSLQGNTYGTTISGTTVGGLVFSITPNTKNFTPRWADIPGLICTNGQLDVTTVYFTGWYPTDE